MTEHLSGSAWDAEQQCEAEDSRNGSESERSGSQQAGDVAAIEHAEGGTWLSDSDFGVTP